MSDTDHATPPAVSAEEHIQSPAQVAPLDQHETPAEVVVPATVEAKPAPLAAEDPNYPYPPGHPNLVPVDSTVVNDEKSVAAGIGSPVSMVEMPDVRVAPLVAAPVNPGTSKAEMTTVAAAVDADFNRMRIVAGEMMAVVRSFPHEVDATTDIGKIVAFFRQHFAA